MSRRFWLRLVILAASLLIILPVSLTACLWFIGSGSGEGRESPDGRYEANAYNMSTGTLTGGREHYIKIFVIEKSSGRMTWRLVYGHDAAAAVPAYGQRGVRFVEWSADSKSVTIPVANGQKMVLAVP